MIYLLSDYWFKKPEYHITANVLNNLPQFCLHILTIHFPAILTYTLQSISQICKLLGLLKTIRLRPHQNIPLEDSGTWPICKFIIVLILFSYLHWYQIDSDATTSVCTPYRSLANNNIKALPRDLFSDLDSLIELWAYNLCWISFFFFVV